MKKITWSVLIGVAFCLLLTGCGSEKKADTSTSSAKKEIKSSTSKNNDKENEKKAEQAKKDKEAQETKEKAEKEKQAQIAQKVKEADTVMKQAETNPTDTTVNNAKSALNAIPDGNPDLQRRLDAVTVALSNAKQQAAEKAQAAQVEAKRQAEQAQVEQEQQAKKQAEQTQTTQEDANNTRTRKVTSMAQAIQIAKNTYGDNNGKWTWGGMEPEMDDGYFVKAYDLNDGTMTHTAQSLIVHYDGSISEN
ncbi:hypothetical protein [Melissococcus plutonius]|uniref:hypothetical protein n=1 Tax=Melissococcus plutonius TaxID=33970 RepID=UPI003C2C278E